MLAELVIENYAVVDRLRIRFHPGLNLLTGETGSGKSILVDALGLLFGARASADMIRSGATRARVSGIFRLAAPPPIDGVEPEDGELIIEREILPGGKSRAYIGGRPVTAALLKDLAPHLGDIHGQHEAQALFSADTQLRMLDQSAPAASSALADLYHRWRDTGRELEELERTEQEKLRLLDLWTFQRREIEDAALLPNEDAALDTERRVLGNCARIQESAGAAYAALYDSPESALALARIASKKLDEIARIDPAIAAIKDQIAPAEITLKEAAYSLRDYLSRLEADPARLDAIELRLATIEKLKRKYGATLDAIAGFLDDVRRNIAAVENAGERIAELRRDRERFAAAFESAAQKRTVARTKAARDLERRTVAELAGLAMDRTVFKIEIAPASWSATGADAVRFLVSANAGEEPRPLDRVASGGELSRIALALKTCLAPSGPARTLVFDEIDTGVGGRAADGIGRRLKKLAAADQILCVTHLAQVASFADHHYVVSKKEAKGRTHAAVDELDATGRVKEIGRMLSGERLTEEALRNAEQLIKAGAIA